MYWRGFKPVDVLPETGGDAVCYIPPDNSWWEYGWIETDSFDENNKPIYAKGWKQICKPNSDSEFRDCFLDGEPRVSMSCTSLAAKDE